MTTQSVATAGSTHGLWISTDKVLTMRLDRESKEFPPDMDQCRKLNLMIQGLARAASAVVFQVENDDSTNAEFTVQPIGDIADAIVLLSQLSQAIADECTETGRAGAQA